MNRIVLAIFALLPLISLGSEPVSSANTAPNPSFEMGTTQPDGWQSNNSWVTFTWKSNEAHTGSHSICISNMVANSSADWLTVSLLPVQPGKEYHFGVWAKGDSDRGAYFGVSPLDDNGNSGIGYAFYMPYNNSSWSYKESVYTAPANVHRVGLYLGVNNPGGYTSKEVCFDDVLWEEQTDGIVDEARKDIGMPYPDSPYHRGCPSDYVGCGGLYHGFYLGVCSDLVMDSYNAGVPFNIQNSLYQDNLSYPGRYRWGSARNADDMRRYFIYNQQFLPHSQAYQAGDIAFFSWNGGPLTDHVLIISQVDANGRPLSMVDASGTASWNPSGRAFEHNWSSYYDQHVQGHGRLASSGLRPAHTPSAETLQVLTITVDSLSVALSLKDSNGKSTSSTYDESLVASNNDAFIPYIPGGTYANLGTSQVISVTQPLSNTTQYIAQVLGNANTLYHLTIQTLQNGGLTAASTFAQAISNGETQGIPLQVSAPGGVITFSALSSASLPNVNITPSPIQMSGLASSLANTSVTVNETSNRQALNGAVASIGTLMDQSGQTIPGTLFTVTPSSFNIAAGGSQNVQLQINLTNISPGVYLGNLMITSANGGVQSVPLSLKVEAFTINLPLILR
jgi:Carbohydrate binding domain